jgi:hypothetical protein
MGYPGARVATQWSNTAGGKRMPALSTAIGLTALLLGLWGCPDGDTPQTPAKGGATLLRIVAKWPGDDFASKQQLETRDKIGRLISESGVGKVVRSATGMGWMDIVVTVEDSDRARMEIEKIIGEMAPGGGFSIEVTGP